MPWLGLEDVSRRRWADSGGSVLGGRAEKSQFGSLRVVWLEAFVLSVHYGKQTAAAAEMGVTQGTISKHIENLELWCGGGARRLLLEHNQFPPVLTAAGEAFFPIAQRAVAALSELKASRMSRDASRSSQSALGSDDLGNRNDRE